jgi:hypothetical protein
MAETRLPDTKRHEGHQAITFSRSRSWVAGFQGCRVQGFRVPGLQVVFVAFVIFVIFVVIVVS